MTSKILEFVTTIVGVTLFAGFSPQIGNRHATVILDETNEPGGSPADAAMASQNPNEYAWRLFFFMNRQAATGRAGEVDQSKANLLSYDADRPTVWESWALSSGLVLGESSKIVDDKSEVFKIPASAPVPWEQLDRSGTPPKILTQNLKSLAVAMSIMQPMELMQFKTLVQPIGTNPADQEVRMNRSTYDSVRTQRLYSVEGLQAAALTAKAAGTRSLVTFDQKSKEIKAQWVHLTDCDGNPACANRARYHWRSVVVDGKTQIWGLAAIHIISKDLPNWFWADFDHVDCERRVGACANDSEGALTPTRDTTTGTNGLKAELAGSKWAFYVLRGTETDFVSPTGVKNILSNPVIENGFQQSSCMTCHSYATVGIVGTVPKRGTSLALFAGKAGTANAGSQSGDIGAPNCARFYNANGGPLGYCPDAFANIPPLYYQTDFLWSLSFRAFSEKP